MSFIRNAAAAVCGVTTLCCMACSGNASPPAVVPAMQNAGIRSPQKASSKAYPTDKPLLFVADDDRNRVYIFPHSGAWLVSAIDVNQPHGIAVSPAGVVYVASYGDNAIYIYHIGMTKPFRKIAFAKPYALFVDPLNDLYISSAETGVVAKYPYQTSKHAIDATPSLTITAADIPASISWQPWGLAMDLAGDLFIANDGPPSPCGCVWELEPGQKVSKIHPVVVEHSTTVLDSGLSLSAVAVAGRVVIKRLYNTYFLASTQGGPVNVFYPTQSVAQYTLQGPYGVTYMTIAANGDIFVSDGTGSNAIYAYHSHATQPFEVLTNYEPPSGDYFSTTDGVATWK